MFPFKVKANNSPGPPGVEGKTEMYALIMISVMLLTAPQTLFRSGIAFAQQSYQGNHGAAIVDFNVRFAGLVPVPRSDGTALTLNVEVKEWHLVRDVRETALPAKGHYVAHLLSGNIVTQIGSKSEVRHTGEFWAVDEGAEMIMFFAPPNEAAILETVRIAAPNESVVPR